MQHDQRSRGYPAPRGKPQTVLWPHHAPILDQFYTNGCTGFALTNCLNTAHFAASRPHRRYLDHDQAIQVYSTAAALDDFPGAYPPDDTGSSGLGACKAGMKLGYLRAYRWAFSFSHFIQAIVLSPLIVGTNWYDSMTYPDEDGFVTVEGNPVGGHEYTVLGINGSERYVTCLNSWGPKWGDRGRFHIGLDVFAQLLDDDGDVTVPIGVA